MKNNSMRKTLRSPHQSVAFKTEWAWVELSASGKGVTGIVLSRTNHRDAHSPRSTSKVSLPIVKEAQAQLVAYLHGTRREFSVPVDLSGGTAFQRRVWRTIQRIPFGRVRSYRWVAARVGGTQYARAVGMALGANPVPIVVPCHRIVAHDGSLGGFSCGLQVKRRLLKLEGTLSLLKSL
jgi:O-6-methylguanine DNA methyltransferase